MKQQPSIISSPARLKTGKWIPTNPTVTVNANALKCKNRCLNIYILLDISTNGVKRAKPQNLSCSMSLSGALNTSGQTFGLLGSVVTYLDAGRHRVGDVLLAAALESMKDEVSVLFHLPETTAACKPLHWFCRWPKVHNYALMKRAFFSKFDRTKWGSCTFFFKHFQFPIHL